MGAVRERVGEAIADEGGDHGGDAQRLATRIALLLEETAHQGLLALRLLVQARDLVASAGATDDPTMQTLLGELEERLVRLEGEGRERLRTARRLLRSAAGGAPGPTQRGGGTRSARSHR
jgi:hypothetical protein